MKKMITAGLIISTAFLMQSCGNAQKDSTEKADSVNQTKDSTDKKHPATWGQEVSGDDAKFAVAAANGGMAEVELGDLARNKGASPAVREFGAMMIQDHSKANQELKDLAASKHIALPGYLNDEEKKLKDELSAKSGVEFDKAYVKAMVEDHEKDVKEFEQAAKKVKYPEMSAFIEKTLPVLKMHLSEIKKIQGQMK
jgi:putative membrane protein